MSDERHFLGLDLGQAQDHTALVALRRVRLPREEQSRRRRFRYEVRGVKRWPLRTPYTRIAEEVADLVEYPPLARCLLGVDATGVGRGVLELIAAERPNATLRPITITAGHDVVQDGAGYRVPKLDLVGVVTALLDDERLDIPAAIPEAQTLAKELRAFRAKVTAAGRETMEADWRSRQHDDIVLGLAIAAWCGEHTQEFWMR